MKILNHRDLPEDRLATTDEKGGRVYLFPAAVKGFWRKRRTLVQILLIAIFLLGPWIRIGGHQMILLDIPRRQFALFGLTFWAHDTPILFLVLLILGIGLAFVTAIWGRIWCGWACPQTVFIDGVFRRIEKLVLGSHVQQMQLAKAPMSREKFVKLSIKWILFAIVGLVISHSFLAYFVGADQLREMVTRSPSENWISFLVMVSFASAVVFDFGWFREQFCIIMCPYGRIQSVLLDQSSTTVMYDVKRGEPRKRKGEMNNSGDCVDCSRCISVCPTGIDIRRGVQLECIACTACIDVCDEVMANNKKPRGLIRYDSLAGMSGQKKNIWTLRLGVYSVILLLAIASLAFAVGHREPIDANILRGHDSPYIVETDPAHQGEILNHFKLHIHNNEFENTTVRYSIQVPFEMVGKVELVAPINPVMLKPGELQRVPFFVRFPKSQTGGSGKWIIKILFKSEAGPAFLIEKDLTLVGPF